MGRTSRGLSHAKQGQQQGETRLLRALSRWILKNIQGWRLHGLSGQPTPLLECPNIKVFSLISAACQPWLWSFCQALLWRAHLCVLSNHHTGTGRLLLAYPEAPSSLFWTSPTPSVSLYRTNTPDFDHPRGSLLNSLSLIDILPLLGGACPKLKVVTRCAFMSAE